MAEDIRAALVDRSPVDLVLSHDESRLVSVNQTSDSISLLRIADGEILAEVKVGRCPTAIARHPNQDVVFVTSSFSGQLHAFAILDEGLVPIATFELGYQPTGVAIDSAGERIYVALTDADRVAVLDWERREVIGSIGVGRWPRYLALSKDGSRLAVGTSGDRGISIVDTRAEQQVTIDRFVGLNIGPMQLSQDGAHVYFPWMVYRRNPIHERNIRLGWVMASRLGRIGFGDAARREAISLDPPGQAVADPHGLSLTSDDRWVVISASGTHELLVLRNEGLPFQDRGSTDHIDPGLLQDEGRFFRVAVGGRPMGLRIGRDDRTVFVANYLDNSIQVVDLEKRSLSKRLFLGAAIEPSLARRGEAIFYDARRSLDQWYSCHSCHYLGGSNAVTMDTMNDGTPFTFKTVLPLQQLDRTGPWTWHGWQTDLTAAMKHSLKTTMVRNEGSDEDARALIAFLSTLESPLNPNRATDDASAESIARGEQIFRGPKGACADCHSGPRYTDGEIHDLQGGQAADAYVGFNTPSLLGVFRKVQLMHDGKASSLEEMLRGPHAPERVRGEPLTEAELRDLVRFLKTL